jgi:hypothetical protein
MAIPTATSSDPHLQTIFGANSIGRSSDYQMPAATQIPDDPLRVFFISAIDGQGAIIDNPALGRVGKFHLANLKIPSLRGPSN